ncbi:hypothetical protein [uncultured Sphaerochaeta sp.]|uniref:hypothetical protein n=1 Tax=uncultured Sphaerochaeta sp. TaxID=886478 RepID=UPI002A0A2BA7|nr:hypothetical protein [uncultured Sphaerochaeta sp.]
MNKSTNEFLEEAKKLLIESDLKAKEGDLAYELQSCSLRSHIDELENKVRIENIGRGYELLDFRMIVDSFQPGSVPLDIVAKIADEFRKMFGHAAHRLVQVGAEKKKVPNSIYKNLNLRLMGILPGSTRLLISAISNRDLFDEGLAKNTIERFINVLETYGEGDKFLEAIMDLGPSSAKNLKDLFNTINSLSGALEINWKHEGHTIRNWIASPEQVSRITSALGSTKIKKETENLVHGTIELLSKRERIHLRTDKGNLIRILFPIKLLEEVESLHLNQKVFLLCNITQTENPLTNESIQYYELVNIENNQ